MSFILDALKKSESDRQRQSGPSLFEVKVAPPRRTLPVWAVAIAVLLGINVIVISWMLLRRGPTQQPAAAAPAAVPAPAKVAGTTAPMTSGETAPMPVAASAASGAEAAPTAGQRAMSGRAIPESARPPQTAMGAASASSGAGAPPTAAAPAASTDQSAAQASSDGNPSDYAPAVEPAAAQGSGTSGGGAGDLPLYQQIVTSDGLPTLHLDLHVFAARPKDRFVMINMTRMGEGDSLPNGVQVEAIRPDGVVLSYHGTRFLLPRN